MVDAASDVDESGRRKLSRAMAARPFADALYPLRSLHCGEGFDKTDNDLAGQPGQRNALLCFRIIIARERQHHRREHRTCQWQRARHNPARASGEWRSDQPILDTQAGQSIDQAIAWAASELETYLG